MPPRLVLALTVIVALAGLGMSPRAAARAGAEYVGSYTWTDQNPLFGGISALEYEPRGGRFVAIGDRGVVLTGRIDRDAGRISGVGDLRIEPLRSGTGRRVGKEDSDAEGLNLFPDGRLLVSFEGAHRVWSYDGPGAAARGLPFNPDFAALGTNSGIEALAVTGDGDVIAIPERSGALNRPFPVFRYRNGRWDQPFDIPRLGAFLPTGADVGPDGRLYLLERKFLGIFGFSSRVRRFSLGEAGLGDEETLFVSRSGQHDNLEGITVWRDADGSIRMLMVSDDNFMPLQRTELVEYRLTE